MVRHAQTSFAAGEVSPTLAARVDLSKYHVGAKELTNFFVESHGPISNRAGFRFLGEAPGTGVLIPFQFNTEQGYVLEFTNALLRVLKDDGYVQNLLVDSSRFRWTASGSGTNEFYLEALAGGDPGIPEPEDLRVGGTSALLGTLILSGAAGSLAVDQWDWADNDALGFSTVYLRLASGADPDSGALGSVQTTLRIASPFVAADLPSVRFAQSADVLFLVHPSYAPRKLSRTSHYEWAFETQTFTFLPAPSLASLLYSEVLGPSTIEIDYTVTAVTLDGIESAPASPINLIVDRPWPAGAIVTVTWNAYVGAPVEYYNVYKNRRGQYGYIGSTQDAATLSFVDDNIEPDTGLSYPVGFFSLSGVNNRPSSVAIHQQRLVYGGLNSAPQSFFGSQLGNFEDWSVSRPLKDTDAFQHTLASGRVNAVRHLVSLDKLILFTSGAEWAAGGGPNSPTLGALNAALDPQGAAGSSLVPPVVIEDRTALFVHRSGRRVRDLAYTFEADGFRGRDLTVLATHLLESRTITSWAFQAYPYALLWASCSDGTMLTLTYLPEHDVWAWSRHETDGFVVHVATLAEADGTDSVYFLIRRTIGGAQRYYVEKQAPRIPLADLTEAFFLDSGLTYEGPATNTVSGLDHLEGKTVQALVDGSPVSSVVVTGGQIVLPVSGTKIHVGLPYVARLETLDPEFPAPEGGTVQGRRKRVVEVTLTVRESVNCTIRPAAGPASEAVRVKWRDAEDWGTPTQLATGDKTATIRARSDTHARVVVEQDQPLPLTIAAIIKDITLGN